LLIAVVILGVALSAVGTVWRTQAQREREQELLFIGREFQAAIAAYYRANAGGGRQYPQDIGDLLEDKRWPEPHHYLRRLYADPMTGAADWTILRTVTPVIAGPPGMTGIASTAGMTGIASSSMAAPLKKAGFAADEEAFEKATCYCDWKFVYVPRNGHHRLSSVPRTAD
jgi:type II secretory pathway pseudopilin PulG